MKKSTVNSYRFVFSMSTLTGIGATVAAIVFLTEGIEESNILDIFGAVLGGTCASLSLYNAGEYAKILRDYRQMSKQR